VVRILSTALYQRASDYLKLYPDDRGAVVEEFGWLRVVRFDPLTLMRGSLFFIRHMTSVHPAGEPLQGLINPSFSFIEQTVIVDSYATIGSLLVAVVFSVVALFPTPHGYLALYHHKPIRIAFDGDQFFLLNRKYQLSPLELSYATPDHAPKRTIVIDGEYHELEGKLATGRADLPSSFRSLLKRIIAIPTQKSVINS